MAASWGSGNLELCCLGDDACQAKESVIMYVDWLVNPEEHLQDTVALDLTSRLAWKTLDVYGAANVMRTLRPEDRAAVAIKMARLGTEPAVANAAVSMSFAPMSGFGQMSVEEEACLTRGGTWEPTTKRCALAPIAPPQDLTKMPGYKLGQVFGIISLLATPILAYHGYRRNKSIGWAIVWGIVGGIFWPIAMPISLAQGFGEPKR